MGSSTLADTTRLIGRHLPKAVRKGGRWILRLAGACESPVIIERRAAPRGIRAKRPGPYRSPWEYRFDRGEVILLDMEVPCRRCQPCRKARAAHWRLRALAETTAAVRTWFCTFTLSDQEQYLALCRAEQLARKAGRSFTGGDDEQKQRDLVRAVSPELTRYWKRVRKNSGAPIKFFWVAEFASSGVRGQWNLHFHALVHELLPEKPVRKAVLRAAWRLGFSRFKVVEDNRQVSYLCKYVSKTMGAGVRASHRYGMSAYTKGEALKKPDPFKKYRAMPEIFSKPES